MAFAPSCWSSMVPGHEPAAAGAEASVAGTNPAAGAAFRLGRQTPNERRAALLDGPPLSKHRRRPTLPGAYAPSTIGAGGLNFRVRNGNGWFPAAIATENLVLDTSSTP